MSSIVELREYAQTLSVLYVEDDSVISTSMGEYLRKFFKEVYVAVDGEEGLKEYKRRVYDLIISDISLPKLNGLDMVKEIKDIKASQFILITSAHSDAEYFVDAIKIGVDGYIIKPFNLEQLNEELIKIAKSIFMSRENEQYKTSLEQMVALKNKELKNLLEFENKNYEQTLYSMVDMIEARDTYTAGHSRRVAEYSKMIAEAMGYTQEDTDKIYQAGFLHDIGKVATPDMVLLNPKKLNSLEYELIQEHVNVGYQLLSHVPMFEALSEIIQSHHERYDGTGYPRGIKGEEIPRLSHIMIVADAFDAMTTNRIYKARKSIHEALEELRLLSEKQFHPEVVTAALEVLQKIYIDENISQVPSTPIEKARFAYFYKDPMSDAYNQNYLDITLAKNRQTQLYNSLDVFLLEEFSYYNKEHGWEEGNKLLAQIANLLIACFDNSLVFRIFGDDFAVLSSEEIDVQKALNAIESLLDSHKVSVQYKHLHLTDEAINLLEAIERF
ncbi:MAG: response regulator [Campylobacterales bacterium]|nr:response regulator [Campylobacterales bacterium]